MAEGNAADLVLLEANPLDDITNTRQIAGVVLDGRYLDREALDELLGDAERAANPTDAARDSLSSADRSPTGESREAGVPRTRTFPGLADAPYPYVEPQEVGFSAERLDALGDRVAGWVRDSSIVGAELLVVKDRRIVLHEATGWSDREAGEPMRRNTIYRIRSMTKPFSGTAAMVPETFQRRKAAGSPQRGVSRDTRAGARRSRRSLPRGRTTAGSRTAYPAVVASERPAG